MEDAARAFLMLLTWVQIMRLGPVFLIAGAAGTAAGAAIATVLDPSPVGIVGIAVPLVLLHWNLKGWRKIEADADYRPAAPALVVPEAADDDDVCDGDDADLLDTLERVYDRLTHDDMRAAVHEIERTLERFA